jgi:hypothetical protein
MLKDKLKKKDIIKKVKKTLPKPTWVNMQNLQPDCSTVVTPLKTK